MDLEAQEDNHWWSRFTYQGIRLGTSSPEEQVTEGWLNLSQWDKFLLFSITMAGSLSCFIICFITLPFIALRPKKFGVLWSFGSILFLASFIILQGRHFIQGLLKRDRIWFTASFIGSIVITLASSLVLKNFVLSLLASVAQIVVSVIYTVSYFPGSSLLWTGLSSSQDWLNS